MTAHCCHHDGKLVMHQHILESDVRCEPVQQQKRIYCTDPAVDLVNLLQDQVLLQQGGCQYLEGPKCLVSSA